MAQIVECLESVKTVLMGVLSIPGFVGSVVLTIHINAPRKEVKIVPLIRTRKTELTSRLMLIKRTATW